MAEDKKIPCVEINSPDLLSDEVTKIILDLLESLEAIRILQIKEGVAIQDLTDSYSSDDTVIVVSGLVLRGWMLSGEYNEMLKMFYESHKIDVIVDVGISYQPERAAVLAEYIDDDGDLQLENPDLYLSFQIENVHDDDISHDLGVTVPSYTKVSL